MDDEIFDNDELMNDEQSKVNNEEINEQPINENKDNFISDLLRSRGIEDYNKIKFENDEGEIEEVSWDQLDNESKLNIINSSEEAPVLNEQEAQLLNAIRSSNLSPAEYIQYLQQTSVNNYIQNSQNQNQMYSVDQYSDEELYVMDLLTKSDNITEEEALEALDKAKSNTELFKKQMGAVRNDYKEAEQNHIRQMQFEQQQQAQEQFNQFAGQLGNYINNFNEFSGYDLNLDNDDKQNIFDFLTGTDNAGQNWFAKALQDPESVTQMAWFLLYGDQMIEDIDTYYKKEIAKVRKESYNKGKKDADKKETTVAYKPKNKVVQLDDDIDLDDDF